MLATLLAIVALVVAPSACGGGRTPGEPSPLVVNQSPVPAPTPTPSPTSPPGKQIAIGEDIRDTLVEHGDQKYFEITPERDGTLTVRVNWDVGLARIELDIEGARFANYPANVAPVVARIPVLSNRTYRITVADGAPWDYDILRLPFVLTTGIQ